MLPLLLCLVNISTVGISRTRARDLSPGQQETRAWGRAGHVGRTLHCCRLHAGDAVPRHVAGTRAARVAAPRGRHVLARDPRVAGAGLAVVNVLTRVSVATCAGRTRAAPWLPLHQATPHSGVAPAELTTCYSYMYRPRSTYSPHKNNTERKLYLKDYVD